MAVINTNIMALIGQQNLSKSQSALQTSMERLSSGLRINSAKDDAAGQAIANRMTSQITGLAQAQRNANDGISVAQTTEGALNQVTENLQRIRELTVQAENGTYSASDLQSIQDEIAQRLSEINRISQQTDFNGVKVLAKDHTLTIQVGANDNEVINVDLKEITASTLGLTTFNVSGPRGATTVQGNGSGTTAEMKDAWGETTSITQANVTFGGDLAARLGIGAGAVATSGTAITDENGHWFAVVDLTGANSTEAGILNAYGLSASTYYVALEPADAATTTTAAAFTVDLDTVALSDLTTARTQNGLSVLDRALKEVDELRSNLGAIQNRFQSAITNLQTNETNLSAARSRIQDADYADEVSNMTRAQILQQAGTSVLAQANQVPQTVLSLLG